MRNYIRYLLEVVSAVALFFSADLVAMLHATPYLETGSMSIGLRVPVIAAALVLFVLGTARILRINEKVSLTIIYCILIGSLTLVLTNVFPVGSPNPPQFLYFILMCALNLILLVYLTLLFFGILRTRDPN